MFRFEEEQECGKCPFSLKIQGVPIICFITLTLNSHVTQIAIAGKLN